MRDNQQVYLWLCTKYRVIHIIALESPCVLKKGYIKYLTRRAACVACRCSRRHRSLASEFVSTDGTEMTRVTRDGAESAPVAPKGVSAL